MQKYHLNYLFVYYYIIVPNYEIIENDIDYQHPYYSEIVELQLDPNQLVPKNPLYPQPIEHTQLYYIDTEDKLNEMINILSRQTEIAVDVEYHSFRSYQGFTCLVQISTRSEDFIVDAIKLRSICYKLNNVFCNPNIVKIFHGADNDILWLQKDLGVYVVNMFDTYQASLHLLLDKHSYAYLVLKYCKISLDKTNQLADWRERPLSEDKIDYARNDTHYLLFIHDCMVRDLYDKKGSDELIRSTYLRSSDICLETYHLPKYNQEECNEIMARRGLLLTKIQKQCLFALHKWRDDTARQYYIIYFYRNDESPDYIMKISDLLKLVQIVPKNPTEVMSSFNPLPQSISIYMNDIINVIKESDKLIIEDNSKKNTSNHVLSFHSPAIQAIDSVNNISELMESVDWVHHDIKSNNNVKPNKQNTKSVLQVL